MILLTIVIFIAILGLLVFVHELGHFVMAKRAGMKVDEFGFGFPPRIFGIRRGETLYSINLIPLGGFVKILGEDGSSQEDPESFAHKSFWQRFLVLVAGVTMNVILAWVLVSIGMGLGLPTVLEEGDQLPQSAIIRDSSVGILEVQSGTPADKAELKSGDHIVKIGGENISTIKEAQAATAKFADQATIYQISRGSEVFERTITPRSHPPQGEGPLGIALGQVARVSYPWYQVPYRGLIAAIHLLVFTITSFWGLIVAAFQGQNVGAALSGPVGIAVLTRDVARLGFIYLLQFTAVLSINLAVINIIPFPALDGGRVLFLIIEKIRGKKMNAKAETIANAVGFILLILLMVGVTVHDFSKFAIISRIKNLF
jgi:regulator of sigma E protease